MRAWQAQQGSFMDVRLTIERLSKLRVMRVDRVVLDAARRDCAVLLFDRGEPLTDITLWIYVADTQDHSVREAVRRHLDPEGREHGWLM